MSDLPANPGTPGNDAVPPLPPHEPAASTASGQPPKRRKRWVLRVLGVLLTFLVLLVLLAPTIGSMGFVKGIVQDQVNQSINGSVEIGGYSLGWTGISANDVKVFDQQKNLILELNKFSTNLSLLGALRGNFALGDTVVDVDLVRVEIGDDGQLNYLKLLKTSAKPHASDEQRDSAKPTAPTNLPAISGKLTVNYKGTVYQSGKALVQIQPSSAVIDIPDINQPITDDVALQYTVNGGEPGNVHLSGSAAAVKANQLNLDQAVIDEKLELSNVNLKALSPFIKLQTDGITAGSLAIKANGLNALTAGGQINVTGFAVAGAPLKGTDRLAIDQVAMPIDIAMSEKDGKAYLDVKHADVLLGKDGQLGKVTVVASAPQDALVSAAALVPAVMQRVLMGTASASQTLTVNGAGSATLSATFDVAALANQLPNTIGLKQGTQLSQGHLTHQTTITLSQNTAKIDTDTKLPDFQGTSDGKPVSLTPIDVTASLSAVGGAVPDLSNVAVKMTSGFMTVTGGGASLSQQKIDGSFDLANLQSQASQFVDLDALLNSAPASAASATQPTPQHVQLAGAGTFEFTTDGDLIKPNGQGKVATSLVINGISASGIGAVPPVAVGSLTASLSGDMHRSDSGIDYKNFAAAFAANGLNVSAANANATATLANENISGNVSGDLSFPVGDGPKSINLSTLQVTSSSGLFGLTSGGSGNQAMTVISSKGAFKASGVVAVTADLKKLNDVAQRFAGGSSTANPGNPQLQSGILNGTLTLARADQPRTDVSFDGAISNLTVSAPQNPITNETIKLGLHSAVPDDRTAIKLDALADSRFLSAKLTNVILEMNPSTAAKPPRKWDTLKHADVAVNVPDLPAAFGLLNALMPPPAAGAGGAPAAMSPEVDTNRFHIIATALDPSDSGSTPAAPQGETPLEAARRRKRERAAARAKAAAAAQAAAAAAPLPPLQVTSGSMACGIAVDRDQPNQITSLTVTDLALSKIALARGSSTYTFSRDIDFKMGLAVHTMDNDQISQIQLTQLDGDLAVAKVTMPQAIGIDHPMDANNLALHGTIKVDGSLTDSAPLLAVLQGQEKPLPYGGTYAISESLGSGTATLGRLLNLVGSIDITNFQELDGSGKVAYTEPTVAIKNDLDYIVAKMPAAAVASTSPSARPPRSNDQAIVRSFTLDMPQSQALSLKFTGRVADPLNKRVIRGLGTAPTAQLDVHYDLAKLWPIIYPTLTPEMQAKYKTLKVTGVAERVFNLSGYFPLAKAMSESIHHLNADGGLALDELDLPQGLTITKLDLPFKMTAGVVQTQASAAPPTLNVSTTQSITANTAIANQGAVDLSEVTLDLGQPSPLLTIAPNHKLLQSVHINPVLAGTLGEGNLLFKDVTQANGLLDVTVVQCDQVPLGTLLTDAKDANASITYSLSDLSIDGPVPQLLSSVLPLGGQGIHGGIQNGQLTLANGEVNNDFALNIVRYQSPQVNGQATGDGSTSATPTDATGAQLVPVNLPMNFSGGVQLATGALKHFDVHIPQGLLPSKFASNFPNGLGVPITGTSGHPTLDVQKALIENAGSNLLGGSGGNGGGLLNGLLGKHKKKSSSDSNNAGQ